MANGSQSPRSVFSASRGEEGAWLGRLIGHPLVQFIAFGLFVGAVVAIIAAGFEVRGQAIQESSIGEVATSDIKATRDFVYTEPDVEATEEREARAEESVPPVFDWQEDRATRVRERIEEAFDSMRTALTERAIEKLESEQPERYEQLEEELDDDASPERWLETATDDQILTWAYELREEHFDTHLDESLSQMTFEAFARQHFSTRLESTLKNVISRVMSNMIVEDVGLLDETQERGVYLRRLRDDKLLIEYHITDVQDRFVPLARADTLIERAVNRAVSADRGHEFRRAIISAASILVEANTTYNESKSVEKREAAREAVSDEVVREEFRKGQVIVEQGHIKTDRDFRIVETMAEEDSYLDRAQIIAGITLFVLLLIVTFYLFGRKNIRRFRPSVKDILFMATTLLLMLFLTWLGTDASFPSLAEQFEPGSAEIWNYLIPVAAAGMLIRLVLDNEHAVIFTIVFAALVGLIADASLNMVAYTLLGSLVGIGAVQQVKHRMALMWSGLAVGAFNVVAVLAFTMIDGELLQLETLAAAAFAFGSGVMSGFFVLAVLPVFETVFGYTTDIKLLELANLNHPLLRELIIRAPGSYHHSMMVGSLSEAAAETVGANPLLCRVGAYFHDVGKAKNPQYFAENQAAGENPHDKLKPNMSALIIKAHVKDGLEMARQHRLPVEIQDFIAQHHGTSLIAYFYHKAKQMEDPDIPEVDAKDYRYPGPKPQTRETAICLLADGVEAASRALPNPSPARLKGLVQKMINKAFTDGQLDECDLTLKDLNSIAQAFTRILNGIYHHRPEYPGESDRTGPSQEAERTAAEAGATPPGSFRGAGARPMEAAPSLGEATSDVWEITKEKVESMQQETDAGGDDKSGKGDQSPADSDDSEGDSDEGRESLPRLGTS
ncbi:MAG: HD family phosphohydrolase [Persicimonas sp.]